MGGHNMIHREIEEHLEYKKFHSTRYLLKELIKIFLTQTDITNINLDKTCTKPHITIAQIKTNNIDVQYKIWDNTPIIDDTTYEIFSKSDSSSRTIEQTDQLMKYHVCKITDITKFTTDNVRKIVFEKLSNNTYKLEKIK